MTFAAPPAAGAAMDDRHVYVPLMDVTTRVDGEAAVRAGTATITALNRETGAVRWIRRVVTRIPPVVGGDLLFVAAEDQIEALTTAGGRHVWAAPLGSRVRAPMLLRGAVLVALTEPDQLIALSTETREVLWRRPTGESGAVLMNADADTAYLAAGTRITAVRLTDGSVAWERTLEGTLSEPAIAKERVFVGSTSRSFWALDPDSGDTEWMWAGRIFGGDIIGAAVEDDVVYVASLDNIVRALNRGNGNQLWRKDVGTRPILPPRVMFGTVVVIGLNPTLTTFLGETTPVGKAGTKVSTWAAPADAELQGAPLIDEHLKPFRVAVVVTMRDGRVVALRPTAMLFPAPALAAPAAVPGRPLPPEAPPTVAPDAPSRFRPFLGQPPYEPIVVLPGRALPPETPSIEPPITVLPGRPLPPEP